MSEDLCHARERAVALAIDVAETRLTALSGLLETQPDAILLQELCVDMASLSLVVAAARQTCLRADGVLGNFELAVEELPLLVIARSDQARLVIPWILTELRQMRDHHILAELPYFGTRERPDLAPAR